MELRRRPERRVRFTKSALLAKHKPCEIMDALVPDRKVRWNRRPVFKRKGGLAVNVSNFSFLDAPLETIATLQQVAMAECESAAISINFLDQYVLDVAPYMALGMMRQNMAPLLAGGVVSAATVKVLDAVGLRQFLRMGAFGRISRHEVWPLRFMRRRRSGTSTSQNIALQPSRTELVADHIAAHINHWLTALPLPHQLTQDGAAQIKLFIGEILNNAERHSRSGGDGEWMYAGFMARRPVEEGGSISETAHICHLSFYSPGRPIASSIQDAPASIREQIERYQAAHRDCPISPETLATVFSCQDGISRVKQGEGNPTGGTGLMDVVEFVSAVGRAPLASLEPKVAIVSGRAYINFSGRYANGTGSDIEPRRLQWFNEGNDVRTPPDSSHVMDLPVSFPGTLITMRFTIDEALRVSGNANGH